MFDVNTAIIFFISPWFCGRNRNISHCSAVLHKLNFNIFS
jgi:hypothetical protein